MILISRQGFLRRVHRWPVLLLGGESPHISIERRSPSSGARRRTASFSTSMFPVPSQQNIDQLTPPQYSNRGRPSDRPDPLSPHPPQPYPLAEDPPTTVQRKQSAAENALELLRNQHQRRRADSTATTRAHSIKEELVFARRSSDKGPERERGFDSSNTRQPPQNLRSMLSKLSQGLPGTGPREPPAPPSSPVMAAHSIPPYVRSSDLPSVPIQQSHRVSRASFSSSVAGLGMDSSAGTISTLVVPSELPQMLDGEHHTDELATKFEAGWPMLQRWLVAIGGGTGDGDFGRIVMVYR